MSERVLLVEDNSAALAQFRDALSNRGYQVTTAVNGLDGFAKVQTQKFDLCIVDHLMPLMNGPQLLKNLHSMGERAPTAVIFLTTQDLDVVEQLPELCIADIVLAKPLSTELLLENVADLLEQTSMAY
ncbi:response regulator [Thalassomonas sp. M1454]|uniref:response regulator n=1 Tax=Thalassomonas sp. M1454 TaxID=2594477 RepID=UPI00118160F4|nr:response regulator [Thalassomonas sp. M1454]TRX57152.1 response regulator [Thalassomonas sp. M1454]